MSEAFADDIFAESDSEEEDRGLASDSEERALGASVEQTSDSDALSKEEWRKTNNEILY